MNKNMDKAPSSDLCCHKCRFGSLFGSHSLTLVSRLFLLLRQHVLLGVNNLDKNHLRAELFDRRVAVYDAMKRFVADITASGTTTLESLAAMLRETRYAQFLFKSSDGISGFINHFYRQGVDLKFVRQEHESIRTPEREAERLQLVQREDDLLAWFGDQSDVIDDKFRPYLQLA
jgi:hypothetical protein